MNIKVRHTGRLDAAALEDLAAHECAIHQDCGFRTWDLPIFAEHGRNYVMEADGEFAGTAQAVRDWDDPATVYLAGFGIIDKWRGRGLGSKFLGEMIRLLKEDGILGIILTVRPDNEAAIKMYDKAGFKTIDEHADKYGRGEDRLVLRLDMKGGS